MANPSNEQRTSSLYPNPLSCSQTEHQQILNEYEESLKKITTPKNEENIDLKKIQEQINLLIKKKNKTHGI